jgi:hypothetical protein
MTGTASSRTTWTIRSERWASRCCAHRCRAPRRTRFASRSSARSAQCLDWTIRCRAHSPLDPARVGCSLQRRASAQRTGSRCTWPSRGICAPPKSNPTFMDAGCARASEIRLGGLHHVREDHGYSRPDVGEAAPRHSRAAPPPCAVIFESLGACTSFPSNGAAPPIAVWKLPAHLGGLCPRPQLGASA